MGAQQGRSWNDVTPELTIEESINLSISFGVVGMMGGERGDAME